MPRTEKQFEKIRTQKIELIKNTALKLFAANGYHSTSISKIASSAKISKGLIYNYFKSKEEILSKIVDMGIDKIFENFNPNEDGHLEVKDMQNYIDTIFKSLQENLEFWKFYYQISVQADAQHILQAKMENIMSSMMLTMVKYFHEQGFKDPETEALIFSASLDGIALYYVIQPELIPLNKIKENLIQKYCTKKI
jgi:AcrR family transcriptional regulator